MRVIYVHIGKIWCGQTGAPHVKNLRHNAQSQHNKWQFLFKIQGNIPLALLKVTPAKPIPM